MWIHCSGADYYLNEVAFNEAMNKPVPPYDIAELVAIQRQVNESHNLFARHLEEPATPDPISELQRYLNQLTRKRLTLKNSTLYG